MSEDRAERFAREAAEYWLENMRRVGADEKALSHFGVDRQHLDRCERRAG